MRYTRQAIKYVFKNFFYLIPFVVVPALLLSLSTDEKAMSSFLRTFFSGDLHGWTFAEIFRTISVLNFSSWKSILAGVGFLIAIIFFVAFLMAFLEKHMRIGKRSYVGVFSKLNDNLISTCGYGTLLLAIYEFWSLIASALLFFISRINAVIMAYVFSALAFLAMCIILLAVINLIYLWLPCMQITGFKAKEALYYSNNLNTPVKRRIVAGQLLFLFIAYSLIFLCAWFAVSFVWFTVLTTILYSFLIMLYCVRMQIVYFDRDNIDRADLLGYYRR